jgi:hypothetical protein
MNSFKTALLTYQTCLPFLYSNVRSPCNIEHVVPVSLLKQYVPPPLWGRAINDPFNMMLTNEKMNSARSNYRFLLATRKNVVLYQEVLRFQKHFQPLQSSCFISHKYRVFIPREEDFGLISRTALHCYREYGVPLHKVVVGGSNVVFFWSKCKPTNQEYNHTALAAFWLHTEARQNDTLVS